MTALAELRSLLRRLDGRGYPAYKDIRGSYAHELFTLHIDHVQRDPFAAPSRLHVNVPRPTAQFPPHADATRSRAIAFRDFLARRFALECRAASRHAGSGASGLLVMPIPGQQILDRSSVVLTPTSIEARFSAGLPARGRRILGHAAADLLCDTLPALVQRALLFEHCDERCLAAHLDTAEDADCLRNALKERNLVAFVADGAVLPRRSGVDARPFDESPVPFRGPESLRVTITLPHAGHVTGMGIPNGITLIVGGGYHGKSTLLAALQYGIYTHIPGDGRERVVTLESAVTIRAENGRRVEGVDLCPFIGALPAGSDTASFRTDNASGSTSQAANLLEAIELGAALLLLDEDTCASNLMIRDARMQTLIRKESEPITPFVDRVRELADRRGVSTILVMGGSGDYFDVADTVIQMEHYVPIDVTGTAHRIATDMPTGRNAETPAPWPDVATTRVPLARSLNPRKGKRDVSIRSRGLRAILYGAEEIEMGAVAQLVDEGQLKAIGRGIEWCRARFAQNPELGLPDACAALADELLRNGLDALDPRRSGEYVAFRHIELGAALNRLRTLAVR